MKDARYHAFHILNEFERKNDRLKAVRDRYFKKNKLSQKDLSRTLVLTNEVVRWRGRLDYWIASLLDKPLKKLHPSVHIILRFGFYEAVMDENIPAHAGVHSWVELTKNELGKKFSGLVNALMRKTGGIDPTQINAEQSLSEWYSYPDWLIEKWIPQFGKEKAIQLCEYFNQPSPIDLRLNCDPDQKETILHQVEELGIETYGSPESNHFVRVQSGAGKVLKSDLFKRGNITVQDRASGAVVELLDPQPGETILDVCAAPGTKSEYIVERMKFDGQVFSSDISQKRVRLGADRAKELNLKIHWDCKDASADQFPMADRILIDAPCTGTGVLGRRTDIRWRREKDDVQSMVEIQAAILNHTAQFLKPNGVLVYATCSLEPEENWNVVESFLKLNVDFSPESGKDFVPNNWLNHQGCLETFPPRDKVDGMFAARLRKK